MKTLDMVLRRDRERFRVPRSVQQIIPVRRIWPSGIFQVGAQKYSRAYRFSDINYALAGKEEKEAMASQYMDLLNSLEIGATTKITVSNRRRNRQDFEKNILIPLKKDGLDAYRKEFNEILLEKACGGNGMVQEKYLTVSTFQKNETEAKRFFDRIEPELRAGFSRLGASFQGLSAEERLQGLHDFYRAGEEDFYAFDLKAAMRRGHDFRDYICPDSFENGEDYFRLGSRYGRVLFLKDYASYIKDRIVSDLTGLDRDMMLSIDMIPIPTDEAVREVETRLLGVETNITNWQRRQNINQNFSATIPYDMEQQREEAKGFLDDLTARDQRMFLVVITLVHTADTKEQLNEDTKALLSVARGSHLCQLGVLRYQQWDGLNTALPLGIRRIDAMRTMTTENLSAFIPFQVQEVFDAKGLYMGENAMSHNLLLCDKSKLMNPNSFILGVPGAGKSFLAKQQIVYLALSTEDDILVCDPEGEYGIVKELGGEQIDIYAGSPHHINALDMVEGYGEGSDSLADKSEFVLSLFEQLDKKGIRARERSLIDRCLGAVYEEYKAGGEVPTLSSLRGMLLRQDEPEARDLALDLELFTGGSLDVFAHPTNVDTSNRMIVYNIQRLGKQLKTMGLLVITDAILNRVTQNWQKGKRTHIFIDEFHVVFENEISGAFFNSAWRRFRKRNAYPTALTQNVEFLLDSVLASTMLSNSEHIVMLNQAPRDRQRLAELLAISEEQLGYITNAEPGSGLLRYGGTLIPFVNRFPKGKIYDQITTKPGEGGKFT